MAAAPRPLLLPLLLFTAAVGALLWSSLKLAGVPVGPVHLGILVYFGLASLLLHRWQEGVLEGRPMLFQQRFMAGLVIKMLVSLVLLVALVLVLPREMVLSGAITFCALYLAYLGFSTARLVGMMRRNGRA